jgi:ABC-type transport system involved in multi-copper enzyme maturation permease subunit
MIAALRYEWTRIITLRSTWWITIGAVVAGTGLTFLVCMGLRLSSSSDLTGSVSEDESREILEAMMTQFSNYDPMFYLVTYVVVIIGVLAWGHEYRHGMIRATLIALPQRWSVWSAKFLVVGAWVTAVVVATCFASLVVALLWFAGLGIDVDLPAMLAATGRRAVYTVLVTWLVMSLTILVRHQTFALVAVYLWPMGVETLIKGIAYLPIFDDFRDATRFLPFNAAGRIMQRVPEGDSVFGDPLNAVGGFIVFGLFTGILMAASLVLFETRDA